MFRYLMNYSALVAVVIIGFTFTSCKPKVLVTIDNGSESTAEQYSADIIIVGAGGAGMTAALNASAQGASVILLEKSASLGGNTLATMSGINGAETDIQKATGVEYSVADFIKMQTNEFANADLVKTLAENSAGTISWLQSIGAAFHLDDRNSYSHIPEGSHTSGVNMVDVLAGAIKDKGIVVLYNTKAESFLTESGAVTGVKARDIYGRELTFHSSAVILATGGYGQNSEMVYRNNPSLTGAITDEIAPTTGDGILMAQALGAAVTDMDKFTTFPMVEATTHQMIFPMYLPKDSIFVDNEGKRFVSEAFDAPDNIEGFLERGIVYAVFDKKHMEEAEGLKQLYDAGALKEGETIESLAEEMGVSASQLAETVGLWNRDVKAGKDSLFGRTSAMENDISRAPFYAAAIGVGIHYCLGGLVINTDTQVMNTSGQPIIGLYAAGEVTGGVHGDTKIDGSTFAGAFIFGKVTGERAAAFALAKGKKEFHSPDLTVKYEQEVQGHFTDGVYEGTGMGRGGELGVRVEVKDGNIVDIRMTHMDESSTKAEPVVNFLIPEIIRKQSVAIDAVSGATLTSRGIIHGVANALGLELPEVKAPAQF